MSTEVDPDRIVFPDEVAAHETSKEKTEATTNSVEEPPQEITLNMYTEVDPNRIVFPDELDSLKASSEEETDATTTNSIEEPSQGIIMRNMIVVPPNCPAGQTMGADGVCRDVF